MTYIQKEMAAFMLKDAVMADSAAALCAERHRTEAIEEKVEVIFHFVSFINMTQIVGGFFSTIILISVMITRYCQDLVQRFRNF